MEDCSLNYTATPVTKTKIAWTSILDETVYTTGTVNPIVGDLTVDGQEITAIDYDMVGVPSGIIIGETNYTRDPSNDLEDEIPVDDDSDSDTDTDNDG